MGFISAPVDLSSPAAIGSTTPNTGAFTTLSANNGTLTANSPAATFTQTWNNAAVDFRALQLNITSTARGGGSALIDARVGGSAAFQAGPNGNIFFSGGTIFTSTMLSVGIGPVDVSGSGSLGRFWISSTGVVGRTALGIHTSNGGGAFEVAAYSGGANIWEQRNSTNAQTFRLYNTYTDASNYERGFFRWSSNILELGAEAAGTGTQRQLRFPLGTVTASTPLSITQTWNSSGVTFT
ncbi:MAG: hypothetical protein EBT82_02325, partial [Micrococcales bacterium]|nr:hypothetical protein [Micrococcales bacterium]